MPKKQAGPVAAEASPPVDDFADDFTAMKVVQLQAECEKRGLDTKGLKAVLVQRLQDAQRVAGPPLKRKAAALDTGDDDDQQAFKKSKPADAPPLQHMKLAELQAASLEKGLDAKGTKAVLLARLQGGSTAVASSAVLDDEATPEPFTTGDIVQVLTAFLTSNSEDLENCPPLDSWASFLVPIVSRVFLKLWAAAHAQAPDALDTAALALFAFGDNGQSNGFVPFMVQDINKVMQSGVAAAALLGPYEERLAAVYTDRPRGHLTACVAGADAFLLQLLEVAQVSFSYGPLLRGFAALHFAREAQQMQALLEAPEPAFCPDEQAEEYWQALLVPDFAGLFFDALNQADEDMSLVLKLLQVLPATRPLPKNPQTMLPPKAFFMADGPALYKPFTSDDEQFSESQEHMAEFLGQLRLDPSIALESKAFDLSDFGLTVLAANYPWWWAVQCLGAARLAPKTNGHTEVQIVLKLDQFCDAENVLLSTWLTSLPTIKLAAESNCNLMKITEKKNLPSTVTSNIVKWLMLAYKSDCLDEFCENMTFPTVTGFEECTSCWEKGRFGLLLFYLCSINDAVTLEALLGPAESCDTSDLMIFLHEGTSGLNDEDQFGEIKAIHVCAEYNAIACAKLLMARGLKPMTPAFDGTTAMHIAALKGHVGMMACLLEHHKTSKPGKEFMLLDARLRPEPGWQNFMVQGAGYTPLHFAVYGNQMDAVKFLLEMGADPSVLSGPCNAQHVDIHAVGEGAEGPRFAALHLAAALGHAAVAQVLLDHNASLAWQRTVPRHFCPTNYRKSSLSVLERLEEGVPIADVVQQAELDKAFCIPLHFARDRATAAALVSAGPLAVCTPSLQTPLGLMPPDIARATVRRWAQRTCHTLVLCLGRHNMPMELAIIVAQYALFAQLSSEFEMCEQHDTVTLRPFGVMLAWREAVTLQSLPNDNESVSVPSDEILISFMQKALDDIRDRKLDSASKAGDGDDDVQDSAEESPDGVAAHALVGGSDDSDNEDGFFDWDADPTSIDDGGAGLNPLPGFSGSVRDWPDDAAPLVAKLKESVAESKLRAIQLLANSLPFLVTM